jgi:hypothetical protein
MHRTFIRREPQPIQAADDLFFGPRHESLLIGIFQAQDELTAGLAGD